jgi:hypothetical protein
MHRACRKTSHRYQTYQKSTGLIHTRPPFRAGATHSDWKAPPQEGCQVAPPLRVLNEHCSIVRVPRARGTAWPPDLLFFSPPTRAQIVPDQAGDRFALDCARPVVFSSSFQ